MKFAKEAMLRSAFPSVEQYEKVIVGYHGPGTESVIVYHYAFAQIITVMIPTQFSKVTI